MTNDIGQTPHSLQDLPLSSLIGGPLDAAVKAQLQAAQTSWDFIRNTSDASGALTVSYDNNGQAGQLQVPLLTIVPMPFVPPAVIQPETTTGSQALMRSAPGNAPGLSCPACGFHIHFTMADLIRRNSISCPSCGLEMRMEVPPTAKSHLQEIALAEELVRQTQAGIPGR